MNLFTKNLIFLVVRYFLRWLSSNDKNHKKPLYTKAEAEDENRLNHNIWEPIPGGGYKPRGQESE